VKGLWQELYKAAMLELDRAQLDHRIEVAHAALQQRMKDLPRSNYHGESQAEEQAIADALQNLRTLQRVEFRTSPAASTEEQPCTCPEKTICSVDAAS
jgi:hypothetical protein